MTISNAISVSNGPSLHAAGNTPPWNNPGLLPDFVMKSLEDDDPSSPTEEPDKTLQ